MIGNIPTFERPSAQGGPWHHARKQRDDLYAKSKRFVHYTSADNALKIIRTKRLWMRNTTCMADYREVEHGYQIF